jgi:hypothetical protein
LAAAAVLTRGDDKNGDGDGDEDEDGSADGDGDIVEDDNEEAERVGIAGVELIAVVVVADDGDSGDDEDDDELACVLTAEVVRVVAVVLANVLKWDIIGVMVLACVARFVVKVV